MFFGIFYFRHCKNEYKCKWIRLIQHRICVYLFPTVLGGEMRCSSRYFLVFFPSDIEKSKFKCKWIRLIQEGICIHILCQPKSMTSLYISLYSVEKQIVFMNIFSYFFQKLKNRWKCEWIRLIHPGISTHFLCFTLWINKKFQQKIVWCYVSKTLKEWV